MAGRFTLAFSSVGAVASITSATARDARTKLLFLFKKCVLDTNRRELRRGALLVPVEPQVFDLLAYLIKNRERVLSKDDIIASIWNGRSISDSTLSTRINAARRLIGHTGAKQRLIRTFPHKGLRFVALVQKQWDAEIFYSAHAVAARPYIITCLIRIGL